MIRPASPEDTDALIALAEASGLFRPEELGQVREMLDDHHRGGAGDGHSWIIDDDGWPVGVAYYAPERMTEGTWNLYLIAVHPGHQRQGRGTALVRHVEQSLADRGGRILLVETSGLASFERTRAFYRACGYDQEARIRDFYRAGEDKIVFRKALEGPKP